MGERGQILQCGHRDGESDGLKAELLIWELKLGLQKKTGLKSGTLGAGIEAERGDSLC